MSAPTVGGRDLPPLVLHAPDVGGDVARAAALAACARAVDAGDARDLLRVLGLVEGR